MTNEIKELAKNHNNRLKALLVAPQKKVKLLVDLLTS